MLSEQPKHVHLSKSYATVNAHSGQSARCDQSFKFAFADGQPYCHVSLGQQLGDEVRRFCGFNLKNDALSLVANSK